MGQYKCSIDEYQSLGLRAGILNTSDFTNPDQKLKVLMALQNAKYHRPSIYASAKISYNKNVTNRIRRRSVEQQKLKPIFNKIKDANCKSFRKNEPAKVRKNEKLLENSEQAKTNNSTNAKNIDQSDAVTFDTGSHPAESLGKTFGHCVITKEEEKTLLQHLSLLHGKKAIKEAERKILPDNLWSKKVCQRKKSSSVADDLTKLKKGLGKTEVDNKLTESRKDEKIQDKPDRRIFKKHLHSKEKTQSSATDVPSKYNNMINRKEPWRIQLQLLSKKLKPIQLNVSVLQLKKRPVSCKEDEKLIQVDHPRRLSLTNAARQVYIRHGYNKVSSAEGERDSFQLASVEGRDDDGYLENSLCSRYREASTNNCILKDNEEDRTAPSHPVEETQHSEKMATFLPPIYTDHHPLQPVEAENRRVNKKLAKNCGKDEQKHREESGIFRRRKSDFQKSPENEKGTRKYSIKKNEKQHNNDDSQDKGKRVTTPLRGFTPFSDHDCESPPWFSCRSKTGL